MAPRPSARAATLSACALLAIAAGTAYWLFRGAPGLSRLPGWFYEAVNKGSFDMLLVAAAIASLPPLVRASVRLAPRSLLRAALCVALGSAALQIAAGVVERQQIRGWTERFYVGHGEFTARAKDVPDALSLLRDYEQLAAANQLGLFGPSKPPGTYAVYLALDRTARVRWVARALRPLSALVARDAGIAPRDRSVVAWTILVLGVCAALCAIPLAYLARTLFGGPGDAGSEVWPVWMYPAWAFATAPVINVITVHLDSTLFPLLSATASALAAAAARRAALGGAPRRSAALAAVGGFVASLAIYCSYGNLPILLLALWLIPWVVRQYAGALPSRAALALPWLGFIAGSLIGLALLVALLDWQPIAGYLRGVAYHRRWRPNLPSAWRYGLAFVEFGLFVGPPLIAAYLASIALSLRSSRALLGAWLRAGGQPALVYGVHAVCLGSVAIVLGITLWMGTPEAARLWLFMLPWLCCAASACFVGAPARRAFNALLVSQVALTLFVKNYLVW